jgi:hypothetical protein
VDLGGGRFLAFLVAGATPGGSLGWHKIQIGVGGGGGAGFGSSGAVSIGEYRCACVLRTSRRLGRFLTN